MPCFALISMGSLDAEKKYSDTSTNIGTLLLLAKKKEYNY